MKDSQILKESEVEDRYGLTVACQRRARREQRGPRFLKLGKMVRYRTCDIEAYLSDHLIETEDPSVKARPLANEKAADSQSAAEREVRDEGAATRR